MTATFLRLLKLVLIAVLVVVLFLVVVWPGSLVVAFYMFLHCSILLKDALVEPTPFPPLENITRIHMSLHKNMWPGTEIDNPAKIASLVTATNVQRSTMPWKPFMGIKGRCIVRLTFLSSGVPVGILDITQGSFFAYDWTPRMKGASDQEIAHFASLLPQSELPSPCTSFLK